METIRNYLETMFANLPNTVEVRKAKTELLQMMEDKYNELIEEGVSDNAAVGTVISEFGNLDEIAADLGIKDSVEGVKDVARRHVSLDEVKAYLSLSSKRALQLAVGIMLIIISVGSPILTEVTPMYDSLAVVVMFLLIGAGVGMIIFSGSIRKGFEYIRKEPCTISIDTADYVKNEEVRNRQTLILFRVIGIVLCALCWLPTVILGDDDHFAHEVGAYGAAALFLTLGLGVLLIVYSAQRIAVYEKILSLNDSATMSGIYTKKEDKDVIQNPVVRTIMSVFWPTVTCVYLAVSFLTGAWRWTWLIWPIGAIVSTILVNVTKAKEGTL